MSDTKDILAETWAIARTMQKAVVARDDAIRSGWRDVQISSIAGKTERLYAVRGRSGAAPPMVEGDCMWCGQHVRPRRVEAGATREDDPAWATSDGDYGCDSSPETCEDGCGSHARPYDLALRILRGSSCPKAG